MSYDKKLVPAALLFVGLYIFYVQKLETALATYGLGLLVFVVTSSKELVLAFFVASLFIKSFNRLFTAKPWGPTGMEPFQVRDAPSITARLEEAKQGGPLQPKVDQKPPILPLYKQKIEPGAITGVLESPCILNNNPLEGVASIGKEEGLPGVSIPASAKARALIYPPAETSVPTSPSGESKGLMNNPYLHNGPDHEAVGGALIGRGTDMVGGGSSDLESRTTHAPA
jgi:hypothetical protein